jgi:hypothetical protein
LYTNHCDMITYDQERGYKFLTYFERANRLYRDCVLSIQKVNESYNESIKLIERMNNTYKEFIENYIKQHFEDMQSEPAMV